MTELLQKLNELQNELHAKKSETNTTIGFKYRSFETLCAELKPLLKKHGVYLYVNDHYLETANVIESQVILSNGKQQITANGFAGIPSDKPGLDRAQLFGLASSYARKYALGGLFLCDDTKDSDAISSAPVVKGLPVTATPTPVVAAPAPKPSIEIKVLGQEAPVATVEKTPEPIQEFLSKVEGETIAVTFMNAFLRKLGRTDTWLTCKDEALRDKIRVILDKNNTSTTQLREDVFKGKISALDELINLTK